MAPQINTTGLTEVVGLTGMEWSASREVNRAIMTNELTAETLIAPLDEADVNIERGEEPGLRRLALQWGETGSVLGVETPYESRAGGEENSEYIAYTMIATKTSWSQGCNCTMLLVTRLLCPSYARSSPRLLGYAG